MFVGMSPGEIERRYAISWWDSLIVAAAAANVAVELLKGEKPKAEMTLYDTPSQLFTPAVVTAENLKAEIIDKKIQTPEELCGGRYAEGCKKLGITQ